MTPGARAQTVIELLDALPADRPADQFLSRYFRGHRYIGSKDRRAIAQLVYDVLRRRAQLDWWAEGGGDNGSAPGNRLRVIAALALIERWEVPAISQAFDGGKYRPQTLDDTESAALQRIAHHRNGLDAPDQSDAVRCNYPAWLEPELRASLDGDLKSELAAFLDPASVDLRVNRVKGSRDGAQVLLAEEGVETQPTPYSPDGLRLSARRTLPALKAFNQGVVEVQDEGSQLAALMVDAQPGQMIADYCAGGGGKTLAMAATMEDRGRIIACDTDERRLAAIGPRLARAGISIAEGALLDEAGQGEGLDPGAFDRVLVDVPCSGTGAWRRSPDAKWRFTEAALAEEVARQRIILTAAADLPKPDGGRLVYVTCSILAAENERQIDWFLAARPDYALMPIGEVWAATIGGAAPGPGPTLRLSPARTGTDGFFVAVLERRA
ncbi:MAG TPA: RsmB/NOP family class I SAM-dependent RNA methyltransferase [Alphaproteobacteria bacterium]|nr:RsmB/NOP family class I SAM-dependent RNA methyltransferase [Alphaproteobacteria bacterium]